MPSSPKIEQALENLRRAAAVGRLPHGLVIAGHPRAAGTELVNGLLQALYGMDEQPERFRQHPDIHWVEPESKSRQIRVDLIRALLESKVRVTKTLPVGVTYVFRVAAQGTPGQSNWSAEVIRGAA